MSKGKNRKPKAGEWSKYDMNGRIIALPAACDHFWQPGALADGWEKCCLCDAVRRYVPPSPPTSYSQGGPPPKKTLTEK